MLQNAELPPTAADSAPVPVPTRLPAFIGVGEKISASLLFLLLFALRIICVHHYRFDSDEPQHLHVVWGWANGMLQYRDIFDNHSPLFQMLCAPLFKLFGVRADVLIPMRHAMLPLFVFDLWCVYKIASTLGSKRMALWTTIAAGFSPIFFLVSTEFRTDDLWVSLWLLALMLVTGGEFKGGRAFSVGLVFGAAFAVSMKSSLLLVSLLLATGVVYLVARKDGTSLKLSQLTKACALALLGMVIIPGLLVAYFASQGALHEMYYGVIEHNTVLGGNKLKKLSIKRFLFPIALIALPFIGSWIVRLRTDRSAALRQVLILSAAIFYGAALKSFWPLITDQDYLPRDPLLVLALAPGVAWVARQRLPWSQGVIALILAAEITLLLKQARPWRNEAIHKIEEIAEVLRLTNPDDYVMDGKGEFIFRRRPFYYVLEGVTIARMKRGLIVDDIPQQLVATKTCVLLMPRMPAEDKKWVQDNYIFDTQKIGVAGKQLGTVKPSMTFSTEIPANYTIITQKGAPSGTLDGQPLKSSQFLAPGKHELRVTGAQGLVAVVWSQAVERGYNVHWRFN